MLCLAAALFAAGLLPTLGLVPFLFQSFSTVTDRYLYLSLLGPALALAWALSRTQGRAAPVLSAVALIALAGRSVTQIPTWTNSETLFRQALRVYPGSAAMSNQLGLALQAEGRWDEAIHYDEQALRFRPDFTPAHFNLAFAFAHQGATDAAIAEYHLLLRANPTDQQCEAGLGEALLAKGEFLAAIPYLYAALTQNPDDVRVHNALALAYAELGRTADAVAEWRQVTRLRPDSADIHYNLALALTKLHDRPAAQAEWQAFQRLLPPPAPRLPCPIAVLYQETPASLPLAPLPFLWGPSGAPVLGVSDEGGVRSRVSGIIGGMIPIRLELRNFMSYGEDVPPLDLSGMRTLCLSGDNGHGKSALLDAITWSLWGESPRRQEQARRPGPHRRGRDERHVHVRDGRADLPRPAQALQARVRQPVGVAAGDAGTARWRSLTGNNAGETEKGIQKLLRMSYDTFLNSAYLRQGQADQFVRQPPGKRKEILADILDLSRYDQLEAKAREKARAAAAEATDLERDINGMDAELSASRSISEAVAALQTQIDELQARRDALRAEWDDLKGRKGLLDSQKQLADSLAQQRAALDAEIRDLTAEQAELRAEAERSPRPARPQGRHLPRLRGADPDAAAGGTTDAGPGQVAPRPADARRRREGVDGGRERSPAPGGARRRRPRAGPGRDCATSPILKRDHDAIAPRVAAADAAAGVRTRPEQALAEASDRSTPCARRTPAWTCRSASGRSASGP